MIVVNSTFGPVTLEINYDLLHVLLNNLIGNAIQHNYPGGRLEVTLQNDTLTIANTGSAEALNTQNIYQRFQKSAQSEGSGLGLALVREICEKYDYQLQYDFLQNLHRFTIRF